MSFKIAAYPKCYEYDIGLHRSMSVFDWIAIANQHLQEKIEGLELYDRFLTSFDKSYMQRVVDAVHEAGFVIPMFICSPDFTHPDPDKRKEALDYEAKMIEIAYFLGGRGTICRILSGQQRASITREQGVQWVIESIQQLIPVAREYGIVLGMENHYKDSQWSLPEFALKKDVFLEIINAIEERQYFGVQYDPSNAIAAGDDPIALLTEVQNRVVSMHASDRYFKEDAPEAQLKEETNAVGYVSHLCHGVVGKGLNNYDRIFQILSIVDYKGWVSIEDGINGIGEILESAKYLHNMRSKYFLK
jgi:sugar phosphate isomerase/epimerase